MSYELETFPDPGFTLNASQVNAINLSLQSRGIVAIEGAYATGKTSLIPLIAHGLLAAELAIKKEKQRQLQSDVARTYTIEEMLANGDDSDEEMYDNTATTQEKAAAVSRMQFPWY